MNSLDMAILRFIGEHLQNGFLDVLMPLITALGEFAIIWIASAAVMLFFKKTRLCGCAVLAALLIGVVLSEVILKNVFVRPRPFDVVEGLRLLITPPPSGSFPSGHTTSSFAAAFIVLFFHGRIKWMSIPAFALAAVMAFSRLYLNVHFFTDILAGVAIGLLTAVVTYEIFRLIPKLRSS